jgi:LPS export ABC transporter protein LptC
MLDKLRITKLNLFLTLLLLVGVIAYEPGNRTLSALMPPQQEEKDFAVLYLNNVTTRQYSDTGELSFEMRADRIQQTNKQTNKSLTRPHIDYHSSSHLWFASADEGVLFDDSNLLILQKNVVIERPLPKLILTTKALAINDDKKTALTGFDIHVEFEHGELRGTGMSWNYEENHLKILNKVSSSYDANK